jgi:gamma-glutamylputrescine oxidase
MLQDIMDIISNPLVQNYWHLLDLKAKPLHGEKKCDVLVVGGGMAGLHAAYAAQEKNISVILIEKNFCGSGASGKSSGFITPDSELSLHDLITTYGLARGRNVWRFVSSGVASIRKTIQDYSLPCDFVVQDTCVVANSQQAFHADIEKEFTTRKQCDYAAEAYQNASAMKKVVNGEHYYGAIRYPGSFSINSFAYCQSFKHVLREKGVEIYEDTPALKIGHQKVQTPHGTIHAERVILCVDYNLPDLEQSPIADAVSQVQTFLMISEPLPDVVIERMFPQGCVMVWDTDVLYTYFRCTGDNRILVGGGTYLDLYVNREHPYDWYKRNQLIRYMQYHFPYLKASYRYFWPGLIGVSKDMVPLAGAYKYRPWLYYVGAATGLPWAAALGRYSIEHYYDARYEFDDILSPYRKFPLAHGWKYIMGKRLTFALSHGISMITR